MIYDKKGYKGMKCNEIKLFGYFFKSIMKHPQPPDGLATWAFDIIKEICTHLNPYQRYMEVVIEVIPGNNSETAHFP